MFNKSLALTHGTPRSSLSCDHLKCLQILSHVTWEPKLPPTFLLSYLPHPWVKTHCSRTWQAAIPSSTFSQLIKENGEGTSTHGYLSPEVTHSLEFTFYWWELITCLPLESRRLGNVFQLEVQEEKKNWNLMSASCFCPQLSNREKYRHEGACGTRRRSLSDRCSQTFLTAALVPSLSSTPSPFGDFHHGQLVSLSF